MPKKTFFKLAQDKQKKILDAAAEEFIAYKNNYKKSSVNRIAERADIAVGSIYKYFYDKNDLFIYLFHTHKGVLPAFPEEDTFYHYAEKELDSSESLTPTGEILADIVINNPDLFRELIFSDRFNDDYTDTLKNYLLHDQKRGLLRSNESLNIAQYMYASLEYLAYRYCRQNGLDYSKDTNVLKKMTDYFFFGLYKDGTQDRIKNKK